MRGSETDTVSRLALAAAPSRVSRVLACRRP
jgi:hypothetical protein